MQEYERALALFDVLGDHVRFVETCAPLVIIHMRASQFQELRAVIDRAAQHAKDAPAFIRCHLLAMQANRACSAGDVDAGIDLFKELNSIPENELPIGCIGFASTQEVYARFSTGQWDLCTAAARKATRIFEQSGDVWSRADVEIGLFWELLHCGRPVEAERLIMEAIPRAERVGHDVAKSVALMALVGVYLAGGELERGEQAARAALAFGESFHFGWLFIAETSLGGILLYRGQTEEALRLLRKATSPSTHFSGVPEGLLALGMTVAEMEDAANSSAAAMRLLPRPGTSRGFGAWHVVLSMTESLCLSGHREEAGRLQFEAEKIAAEWDCNMVGFPVLTAAGIAAACAGNWTSAEKHHRASIARMEAVPYVTAQPIARYWYADMLAERGDTGDIEAAKGCFRLPSPRAMRSGWRCMSGWRGGSSRKSRKIGGFMFTRHLRFVAQIHGSPELIFDLIADLPNYGRWLPDSSAFGGTVDVVPYPVRLGTRYLDAGPIQKPGSVASFRGAVPILYKVSQLVSC